MIKYLFLLFPLFSYSQGTWIFQLHGYRCTVVQQCVTVGNQYSLSISGAPPTDYNGSQMEIHFIWQSQNGTNQGGNGFPVPIAPDGTGSLTFNLSGTVNLWCYDPENCCSPRSAAQFDFGQINYYQCVLFPIILDYIRIQNGSLVWQTSMEQNVSYYQVQGAIEHGTWQNIARVPAKGASIYSYRINDIQAALEPILALLFLGALLYRKKFQILAIAMLVIAAHCTKDNQTVQPPAMKYFRIQEFDIGKPLPVWNSEVVPL
jgi:hypothetical protein